MAAPAEIEDAPDRGAAELPLRTILAYSAPGAGLGLVYFIVSLYLMKFATDVLLIAPGVMGTIFGLSRIWDAVSDPVVGYLSDRTRSRWGRRRSWMLASALPIALTALMMWSPPRALSGSPLALWMGVSVFGFFTALTLYSVPHEALGAELSTRHHERTRVFGWKQAVNLIGTFAALGVFWWLLGADDPRGAASLQALAAGGATALLIVWSVLALRERPDYQGRGAVDLFGALRDVLANGHARLLFSVFLIESFGTAMLAIVTPYAMQYLFHIREQTAFFILAYFVPALLFIPVWVRLSRVHGKRNLWIASMSMMALAFGALFFVPEGAVEWIYACGILAGIGGGCGSVVGPSIQADVIDWDEYRTGERKEGVYFAVWNFVKKSAYGLAAMVSGFLLATFGYEANVEQTETAKLGLRLLFGAVPGLGFLGGTLLFLRFRLDQREHARIQRVLDERARENA